jgi:hypothetical protein
MQVPKIAPREERRGRSDRVDPERGVVEAAWDVGTLEALAVLGDPLRLRAIGSEQPKPRLEQVQKSEWANHRHAQAICRAPSMFAIQLESEADVHLVVV